MIYFLFFNLQRYKKKRNIKPEPENLFGKLLKIRIRNHPCAEKKARNEQTTIMSRPIRCSNHNQWDWRISIP